MSRPAPTHTSYPYIQNAFNRASTHYHTVAAIQKRSATRLGNAIVKHCAQDPHIILDLGTGTGYMAHALHQHSPYAHFMLNDCAPKMLAQADAALPGVLRRSLHLGDMTQLMETQPTVDLITSNFALQWVPMWMHVLRQACHVAPLVGVSLLIRGTFSMWYDYLRTRTCGWTPIDYPTVSDVMAVLQTFPHRLMHYDLYEDRLPHQTPHHILKHLKTMGAQAHTSSPLSSAAVRRIYHDHENTMDLTYHIMHIVLKGE